MPDELMNRLQRVERDVGNVERDVSKVKVEMFEESGGVPGGIRGILRELALTDKLTHEKMDRFATTIGEKVDTIAAQLSEIVGRVNEHDKFNTQIQWLGRVSKPVVMTTWPLVLAALLTLIGLGIKAYLVGVV